MGCIKKKIKDFPGSPVVASVLPMQGAWVRSLGTKILHAEWWGQKLEVTPVKCPWQWYAKVQNMRDDRYTHKHVLCVYMY